MRSRGLFGALSVLLLLSAFVLDVGTPTNLVVGILLSVPIALSAFAMSRRFTLALVGLAMVANVVAAVENIISEGGWSETAVLNRVFSMLSAGLVGFLTFQLREASAQAERLRLQERRAREEWAVRALTNQLSRPLDVPAFLKEAAEGLRALLQAKAVAVGHTQDGRFTPPFVCAGNNAWGWRPGSPVPMPARSSSSWSGQSEVLVSEWRRRSAPAVLVAALEAQESPALFQEAVTALEPLLEQAVLLADLRRQQAELERRNDVIRDLVYAFSHDLRTPLMANAMSMKLALQGAYGSLPEEYRQSLEHGLASNQDLLDLADKLLLVAKLESGELSEGQVRVNFRSLVLGRSEEMQSAFEARHLRLQRQLESEVRVKGNPAELRRVVQNLLDNALKFAAPGSTVEVHLREQSREAHLQVINEGPPVPAEVQRRLFQRFRGSGAGAGSGLGLYLAHSIIIAHHGQLTYQRTADARTVFEVTLPLDQEGST